MEYFLSVSTISGLPEEFYYNSRLSNGADGFVDGVVIAATRTLPTWSDGDISPIPSIKRKAELQEAHQERKGLIVPFLLMDNLVRGRLTQWKANAKDQRVGQRDNCLQMQVLNTELLKHIFDTLEGKTTASDGRW